MVGVKPSYMRLSDARSLETRRYLSEGLEQLIADYGTVHMSASIGPGGNVAVEHEPGESYTPKEQQKVLAIPGYGEKIHRNRLTGKYIDEVYRELMDSEEGRAYVEHLKQKGNGRSNPGMLETIIVANAGKGLVAATVPDHVKANLIVNADYIESWAREMSRRNGLSVKENIKGAIMHELNHAFYQSSSDRSQSEPKVEFDNDFSLIKFYMELAGKSTKNKDLYVKKARLFTERYKGPAKQVMDSYIARHDPSRGLESKVKEYTPHPEHASYRFEKRADRSDRDCNYC